MRFSLKTKISTPQYQATRAFYERVFRMTVAEEWDDTGDVGAILAFTEGSNEAYLEVYFVEDQRDFSGVSLQFKVDSLEEFVTTLPDGIDFEGPTPRPWGSHYVYLLDPNGIQVVVYEGGL